MMFALLKTNTEINETRFNFIVITVKCGLASNQNDRKQRSVV